MSNQHANKPKTISLADYEAAFGGTEDNETDGKAKVTNVTGGKSKRERALDLALDCRKFEIDLYWKRAGYFWTLIGATLAGFVLVRKESCDDCRYLSVVLGCVGFVFSYAWYCVNRGSKKWQENWENHVDLLEDKVVGPLFKIVTSRPPEKPSLWSLRSVPSRFKDMCTGPSNFSVSKINQIVSLFVVALWVLLIIEVLLPFDEKAGFDKKLLLPIFATFVVSTIIGKLGKSDDENYDDIFATQRTSTIKKPDL